YRPSGPEQRMLTIVARANGDPAAVAALMRTAAQRIDPRIVVRMPRTIESVLQQGRIAETRFQTTLFVLFAALGCCLTAVGVYGVIGYWVSGRTQEMGIRLALGASPRRLQGLVLAQAARPLAIGVALGLGGAFVLTRQLQSLLYGITPHDPTTLAGATVLLVLGGLAGGWVAGTDGVGGAGRRGAASPALQPLLSARRAEGRVTAAAIVAATLGHALVLYAVSGPWLAGRTGAGGPPPA